uniref:calcium/sodium antiporter n=1 Tax=uncultured Gemmiger sp. TaxID=1623490 RepID=UPI00262AE88E
MLIPVLLFIVGLLFLIKGGDWFVDGASALARRFHLPELLIGATVVSIGTTLPEVMVSTMSALSGHGEIAYGNAIGSVICNAALIAAITIAVRPGKVDPKTLKMPVLFFFAAAAIYCVAAYGFGKFTRPMGFIMLAMFVAYIAANIHQMKNAPAEEHEEEEETMPLPRMLMLLVLGAVLIAMGANLLVDNGTLIAQALGVPESVIALTFVALGTSLPELVTAITSLIKGHSDLSLGNVVGANVFNLVLVSGVSVALAPFTVPQSATIFGMNSS